MTCSDAWDELPAWGSAPEVGFWVALEQTGAWGAKAFVESDLDPALGAGIEGLVAEAGGRALLVRHPERHRADSDGPRQVLVQGGPPEAPWLGAMSVDEPQRLLDWLRATDLASLATLPERPAPLEPHEPVLLVCSNGRRDRCCALRGRSVSQALAGQFDGRLWECTHLNGHRWAATAVALPTGQVLARLDEAVAREALAGGLVPGGAEHDRGRSGLPAPLQAADAWVRERTGETRPGVLRLVAFGDVVTITSTEDPGACWHARVHEVDVPGGELPVSCGKDPVPSTVWQVDEVTPEA